MIIKYFALIPLALLISCNKQSPEQSQQADKSPPQLPVIAEKKITEYDGPLGIKKGIPTSDLTSNLKFNPVKSNPSIFTGEAPKKLDVNAEYVAVATEKQGLCKFVAMIPITKVNSTGDQLKETADKMKDLMSMKYGDNPDKLVYFGQDVYRRNSQFFMMALKEESVAYSYSWEAKKIKGGLPYDLDNIVINISADSMDSGYVKISYEFNNFDQCQKEMKQKSASNL